MRLVCILLLDLLLGCNGSNDDQPDQSTQHEANGDGWETVILEHLSIQEQPLQEMVSMLLENPQEYQIHSVVIVKNGLLVFETCFKGLLLSGIGNASTELYFYTGRHNP